MKAMVLTRPGTSLVPVDREVPTALPGEVVVKVRACGVCRTDLHIAAGELPDAQLPIVPGHEIVGRIEQIGDGVTGFAVGDRIGVPWLGYSCDDCRFCRERRENLCREARFTGYQLDGGYAEYAVADARYAFKLPDAYGDAEAAPLLCAGLIGYRSYRMTGDPGRLGLYGFGAAAHIIAQVAVQETREVYAFTSPGDTAAQQFAMSLGAVWAGSSTEPPPRPLDAAIIFAPVGALVPEALSRVGPGRGRGLRRNPHERHPVVPVRAFYGRSGSSARSQTSRGRMRPSFWRWPRGCASRRTWWSIPSPTPTRRSTMCAADGFRAPRC